jgi:hypothetical protein
MGKSAHANRCNVNNPNNPAYRAAQVNRGNQLNPNHPEFKGGKSSECSLREAKLQREWELEQIFKALE